MEKTEKSSSPDSTSSSSDENSSGVKSQEYSEELVISGASAGSSDKQPNFKISMLNSIETNKLLISKSYTEFKDSPSIKLLSKSYSDMNQNYLDDLTRDEKSLYDYDTVRKLLSDMESKIEANKSLVEAEEAALDVEELGDTLLQGCTELVQKPSDFFDALPLPIKDIELAHPVQSSNQFNLLFQENDGLAAAEDNGNHSNSCSNNTSYAELPSIRSKSPNKCDESLRQIASASKEQVVAAQVSGQNNGLKDCQELPACISRKDSLLEPSPTPNKSRHINLNASIQSLTSQCTIDSLAKRVQRLVGPVDYKSCSYQASSSMATYKTTDIPTSRHSQINYDSIYKELDSIQDTLRGQANFNRHLENLASLDALNKYDNSAIDSYLENNNTANSRSKYEKPYLEAASQPYCFPPNTNTNGNSNSNMSNSADSNYSTSNRGKSQYCDYKPADHKSSSQLKPSTQYHKPETTNNSYVFDHTSKSIETLKSDLAEIAKIKACKLAATTAAPYSASNSNSAGTSYDKYSDPRANYLTTSVARMNSLATTLLPPHRSKPNYELDTKSKASAAIAAANLYTDCSSNLNNNNSSKQNLSNQEATVIENSKFERTPNKSETDTIESSHFDSDDAKGPDLPADCYGSRLNNDELQNRKYIYDRRESALLNKDSKDNRYRSDSYLVPKEKKSTAAGSANKPKDGVDESILDSEYLRSMDKKLKKMIKKNLSRDLKSEARHKKYERQSRGVEVDNPVAWDIPAAMANGRKQPVVAEQSALYEDSLMSDQSNNLSTSFQSHPYLPLKNVPMHEIVKKLQREFELEDDCKNLPADMNRLWLNMKSRIKSEEKIRSLKPADIAKFNKFIQNPVSTLIDDSSLGQANQESASGHKHKRQNQPASQVDKNSSGSEATVTPSRGGGNQRASLPTQNFDIENLKHLDKLQLHDVINRKKEEHERRIKALEKLTKLEKLQAEKLEKILTLNKSNSDTGELSQGDESGCGVGPKPSSGACSRRKKVAVEADKQKKVAHFDMADMTIGDDTMDMASMLERDMWNETERNKKKNGARGDSNYSFDETNDTFMDHLDKSTIDESFGNAKTMKSSLKKALFESDDSNLTLNQSDIEATRPSRQSRRVKVVKESQRKNMVGFEEIEEEDEDEYQEDQEEHEEHEAQEDEEEEEEEEKEQGLELHESCDCYTLYKKEKEKSRRSRSSSRRQVAARAISSTPNKSYKEATCSRNQNHKHMERPIAWAYNTENSFPDHAITKLTDSCSRDQRLVPATACDAHKPPGPKKMSLQEAFEMNRYDLISRSRQRQKEIQLRTEQRQLEAEYEIERMAVLQKNLEMSNALHLNQRHNYLCNKKKQQPAAFRQAEAVDHFQRAAYFEIHVDKFAQKRAMTQQEIKSMTRRNYSKLPEVKEKQLKKSAEEVKRRNRLKSDLYKKTIQKRVLSRGPNFNLNFKALENSIQ